MSKDRYQGDLDDRQLQLVEHYASMGGLEPTAFELAAIEAEEKEAAANLRRLQNRAEHNDKKAIHAAEAEIAKLQGDEFFPYHEEGQA